MSKAGNRVVFEAFEKGGYVEDVKTKARTEFTDKNGEYILSMWVKKKKDEYPASEQGFMWLDIDS